MTLYEYVGERRDGIAVTGRLPAMSSDGLVAYVERAYRQGYRSLTVRTVQDSRLVAQIGPHPGTGYRTWWCGR